MKNMKSFSNLVAGDKIYGLSQEGHFVTSIVTNVETNGTHVINISFILDDKTVTKGHVIGLDGYMRVNADAHDIKHDYRMFANLEDVKTELETRIKIRQDALRTLIMSLTEVNVKIG